MLSARSTNERLLVSAKFCLGTGRQHRRSSERQRVRRSGVVAAALARLEATQGSPPESWRRSARAIGQELDEPSRRERILHALETLVADQRSPTVPGGSRRLLLSWTPTIGYSRCSVSSLNALSVPPARRSWATFASTCSPRTACLAFRSSRRCSTRARYPSVRRRVDAVLDRLAVVYGVTRAELEELTAPECGLDEDGVTSVAVGSASAELRLQPSGSVDVRWVAHSGRLQKSAPAQLRRDAQDEVAAVGGNERRSFASTRPTADGSKGSCKRSAAGTQRRGGSATWSIRSSARSLAD